MRTIRRLYFYLVAFISLEVVLWGMIDLLRSVFSMALLDLADALAQALALVLVGVPILLFHWLWVQRTAYQDEEEQTAILRSVFYYAVLLATSIPIVQNLLALLNRSLLEFFGMDAARALLGSYQTWQDNLIAILINAVAAAYFWTALQRAWRLIPDDDAFKGVRRTYRFLWLLYSLLMVVFGAQQTLWFLSYLPSSGNFVAEFWREALANGIALLLVGTPIWTHSWRVCQQATSDPAERDSNLRLGVLYLITLAAAISVLSAAGTLLALVLRLLLGEAFTLSTFIIQAGGPLSLGLPLAGVWSYYGGWLKEQIRLDPEDGRQTGKRRLYFYFFSAVGLGTTLTGTAVLFSFLIDLVTYDAVWGAAPHLRLSGALATLATGLPVWISAWKPMQAEAFTAGEVGERARRSISRRAYLYLVVFAGVIGGMVSGVWLAYTLFRALLDQETDADFTTAVLNASQLLFLFTVLLSYHLRILRQDGRRSTVELAARQRAYPVLVLLSGREETLLASLQTALSRHAPGLPVSSHVAGKRSPKAWGEPAAIILPAGLALRPPAGVREWLHTFNGQKIVVAEQVPTWLLDAFSPEEAAKAVRRLADGESIQQSRPSGAWEAIKNIAVIWLILQILFALFIASLALFA